MGGTPGVPGTNGAVRVAVALSWPHGSFEPREISGEGSTGKDLLGKFGRGEEMPLGGAGEALVDAVGGAGIGTGAERGFCDWGAGADVTPDGLGAGGGWL